MKRTITFDINYLKHCKQSSPEAKLEWLNDALEFARAKKRVVKKMRKRR